MTRKPPWPGRLRLGHGWALYVGLAGDTEYHAHHAIQISVGRSHPVDLRTSDGHLYRGTAVLVPPDVPHCLLGGGEPMTLLFLEPESALGRSLLATEPTASARILEETQAEALRTSLPGVGSEEDFQSALQGLTAADKLRSTSLDPRVRKVIRWLKETGGIGTLDAAARAHGLSSSRLGHLFSAQVGLPFRPFALWLRLQGALAHVARGANLTEAAHGAGFADSAHLTRTFRRMFGVAPSDLARSISLLSEERPPEA